MSAKLTVADTLYDHFGNFLDSLTPEAVAEVLDPLIARLIAQAEDRAAEQVRERVEAVLPELEAMGRCLLTVGSLTAIGEGSGIALAARKVRAALGGDA